MANFMRAAIVRPTRINHSIQPLCRHIPPKGIWRGGGGRETKGLAEAYGARARLICKCHALKRMLCVINYPHEGLVLVDRHSRARSSEYVEQARNAVRRDIPNSRATPPDPVREQYGIPAVVHDLAKEGHFSCRNSRLAKLS